MPNGLPSTSGFGGAIEAPNSTPTPAARRDQEETAASHADPWDVGVVFLFFLSRGFLGCPTGCCDGWILKQKYVIIHVRFFGGVVGFLFFWMPVGVRSYFKSAEDDEVPNPQNSHHHWLNESTSMGFPAPMLNHVDICTFCRVISNDPNRCLLWKETGKIELTTQISKSSSVHWM